MNFNISDWQKFSNSSFSKFLKSFSTKFSWPKSKKYSTECFFLGLIYFSRQSEVSRLFTHTYSTSQMYMYRVSKIRMHCSRIFWMKKWFFCDVCFHFQSEAFPIPLPKNKQMFLPIFLQWQKLHLKQH